MNSVHSISDGVNRRVQIELHLCTGVIFIDLGLSCWSLGCICGNRQQLFPAIHLVSGEFIFQQNSAPEHGPLTFFLILVFHMRV